MTPRRLLTIRPDPPLTAMLGTVLDLNRFQIESCWGDIEAVRRLRARAIDVVITDPITPIEEDLALAEELQRLQPDVRVIALAPEASRADVIGALRAHVFACFRAPFDYGEITSMASHALMVDSWNDGIQVVSGTDRWLTLRVSCQLLTAERVVHFMSELQRDTPGDDSDLLVAAFREMLLNAMEYGAGFDAEKVIEVTAARTARAIVYHFKDPGEGFDQKDLAHATTTPTPEAVLAAAMRRAEMGLRPGGFGMLIASQVADELVYNERGNEVVLIKHLDKPAGGA